MEDGLFDVYVEHCGVHSPMAQDSFYMIKAFGLMILHCSFPMSKCVKGHGK
jgi:hypothetical protein